MNTKDAAPYLLAALQSLYEEAARLDAVINGFVPQRLSRNAGETAKSLDWRITLMRKEGRAHPLVTDYMQGIGHQLAAIIGQPAISQLREAFQDY